MLKRSLLLLLGVVVTFSVGRAQTVSPGVGFAVVTPQGGNTAGFLAVGTLFTDLTVLGGAVADVGPAPILTDAALRAHIGGAEGSGTGLALVNPSVNAATVNLALFNAFGVQIANRSISIAGRNQISAFVNSIFQIDALPSSALLRIHSNIAVAILALDFDGFVKVVPITDASAPPSGSTGLVAVASPTPGIGGTCPTVGVICPVATPVVPPSTSGAIVRSPSTLSGSITRTVTTAGAGAFVFPQVVPEGVVAATITIANLSSTTTQVVRFDFFNSAGDLIRSITNIPIAPQGFVVFSSSSAAIIQAGE